MSRFTHRIRISIGVLSATAIAALASCDSSRPVKLEDIRQWGIVYGTVTVGEEPVAGQTVTFTFRDSVCSRVFPSTNSRPTDKVGKYSDTLTMLHDRRERISFCVTASYRTIDGDSATAVGILQFRVETPLDSIRLDLHIPTPD